MMKAATTKELVEQKIETLLKSEPIPLRDIKHVYGIISTPRSGSTMFADKLKSTGCMGDPAEWVNLLYMNAYREVMGTEKVDFQEYLKLVMRHSATENGVFGLNFHVHQYRSLMKKKIDLFKYLEFKKIYSIERRNKLDQAFSYVKARATDVWSSDVQPRPDEQATADNLQNSEILRGLHAYAVWQEMYEAKLAKRVDAVFYYEDVVKDKEGLCFQRVMRDLEQRPPDGHSFETLLKRQSTKHDRARIMALKKFIVGK